LRRYKGGKVGEFLLELLLLPEDEQPLITVKTETTIYGGLKIIPSESCVLFDGKKIQVCIRRGSFPTLFWNAKGQKEWVGEKGNIIKEVKAY
jgi:hypothetical protein